jgi:hypothetical protein
MPTYQGPPPPKTCWVCHHTLNHPTGRGRKRKTCNDSCRNTGRKIKSALSNPPEP